MTAAPTTPDQVRPVTVLFADIVGSTKLGERLAPEEVKALVGECVTMMGRAVEEYGGYVQAYQGDGICAYFGVPAAHEDDPERAARAGLRILEVVASYARDIELAWGLSDFAVRVGVNTGHAAVGTVGGEKRDTVALGDVTNVAARLQSAAQPGTIVVGDTTARRLSPRFVFESLGDVAVKGRAASVRASRLVGAATREAFGERTPTVGRDDELAVLREAAADLAAGRACVLLLAGDPGIGKTRLLQELRELVGDGAVWLEGSAHSYGGPRGWPFVELLLHWLGAEIGEPQIAVRTKMRSRLGALDVDDDVFAGLTRLLRFEVDDATESAFVRWLESLAARRPVVVALDDAHWADEDALRLAESVLALTDRAPVALVLAQEATASPLRFRALGEHGHRTTELSLAPLSEEAADALLAAVLPDSTPEVREGLVREAEGNPLYLEELARALREGVLTNRGRTWTISVRSSEALPPALENLLVARIDRLEPSARELAQRAAAIGRAFPVRVLEALAGRDVSENLAELLRAEVVRDVRRYPEFECSFSHGLLQQAALATLTAASRRELYAAVAAAFESAYADALDDHLERIAHYHAQAGNLPRALEYLERSGRGDQRTLGLGAGA